eukprot:COSAG01_NODE_847_length_13139_cov_35.539647_11_plen_192_part_00
MEPTGRLQLKEVTRQTRQSEPDTATRAAADSDGERGHLPAPKQPHGGGADPQRPRSLADHTQAMHLPLGRDGNGGAPQNAPPQQPQPADGEGSEEVSCTGKTDLSANEGGTAATTVTVGRPMQVDSSPSTPDRAVIWYVADFLTCPDSGVNHPISTNMLIRQWPSTGNGNLRHRGGHDEYVAMLQHRSPAE